MATNGLKMICLLVILLEYSSICMATEDTLVDMLEEMLEMLKYLKEASNERHWKINGMTEDVTCLQNDFLELKQRMVLLKAASFHHLHYDDDWDGDSDKSPCEQHSYESANSIEEIEDCVCDIKKDLKTVASYFHPCWGYGWKRVVYLNMNDPNETCPDPWQEQYADVDQTRRACFGTADPDTQQRMSVALFPVEEEYSEVCGSVQGYAPGTPDAFNYFYFFHPNVTNVSDFFASGVTVGIDVSEIHVWSFIAGAQEDFDAPDDTWFCPCEFNPGGEHQFYIIYGPPPGIVGTDYFCESVPSVNDDPVDFPLWDGLNCGDNQCCDYGAPPYFTRVLDTPTSEGLTVTISVHAEADVADIGIFKMDLYVR